MSPEHFNPQNYGVLLSVVLAARNFSSLPGRQSTTAGIFLATGYQFGGAERFPFEAFPFSGSHTDW